MTCHALLAAAVVFAALAACAASAALPVGGAPEPVAVPHFPSRVHALIWRNWPVVEAGRLAKVLGTSVENVRSVATSMGLPAEQRVEPAWPTRGYITVLRRNWHLLPYDQLLELLGMTEKRLAYCLREDDFLFAKLGRLKPRCARLTYAPPDEAASRRCAEIRRTVRETFGERLAGGERRFGFLERLSAPAPAAARAAARREGRPGPRFIYSYFAAYGDPLGDAKLDPYPDGLLQRLAERGVNGVWLHTVLRTLAPSRTFPEFGRGWEGRLANLRRLVRRAKRFGIGVYLYVNEPRAQPGPFFARRADMKGVREGDHFAMCTSSPAVRRWISDSLAHVFSHVPDLAGVFTITASENLTNCASHHRHGQCPRCAKRSPAEIIAEVNAAVAEGVHRGSPKARTIVWDWGWRGEYAGDVIARLPKRCWLMSVSEWSKPITRGGIATTVGEYSLSAVGPGPRAAKHWALAKEAGLRTVAKVQLNNSWELSTVPYLPVMDLVARHCGGLARAGVDGMMLSWSLGGYPSPNLRLAAMFGAADVPTEAEALSRVAVECFGRAGASHGRRAWTAFSRAFGEYPFHIGVVYRCPVHVGPANLLYASPTGYRATMTGIPYDDVNGWRGPYPADVFADQFAKVAAGWREGLAALQRAVEAAPKRKAPEARAQLRLARMAGLHFRSVANQARFTTARDELRGKPAPSAARSKALRERMRRIVCDEIAVAREAFELARADSRIGFEAANQYFYLPADLAEKVINCRHLLDHELAGGAADEMP